MKNNELITARHLRLLLKIASKTNRNLYSYRELGGSPCILRVIAVRTRRGELQVQRLSGGWIEACSLSFYVQ